MLATIVFVVLRAAFALAQCEAPVPCTDPTLNALHDSDCQTHHIFVLRGSDSGYPGHNGPLIAAICEELDDCGYEDVIYPANSSYAGVDAWCNSAAIGARNAQAQLTSYAEKCPDSKLIVLGYSQGGSVALDTLGGGGGPVFKCTQADIPALDRTTSPGSHIVAAAVFGAAVRTAGQSYTVTGDERLLGGKDFNGTSPRSEEHLAGLAPYSRILRDYCNYGDPICAKGSLPEDVSQHLNYFKIYTDEAAKWIVETVQGKPTTSNKATHVSITTTRPSSAATSSASKTGSSSSATSLPTALSASSNMSKAGKGFSTFGSTAAVVIGIGALFFCI